jgi:hypothetical protein
MYEPFGEHVVAGAVGPWTSVPMVQRTFPKGNVFNHSIDLTCDASGQICLPTIIADEYYVQLSGLNGAVLFCALLCSPLLSSALLCSALCFVSLRRMWRCVQDFWTTTWKPRTPRYDLPCVRLCVCVYGGGYRGVVCCAG